MNKKTLVTKILKLIYKANIFYKKSPVGDIVLLALITIMISIGPFSAFSAILIIIVLRGVYELGILERLGVIYEEENKKDDDQNSENIG
jgi:hypothetical protein